MTVLVNTCMHKWYIVTWYKNRVTVPRRYSSSHLKSAVKAKRVLLSIHQRDFSRPLITFEVTHQNDRIKNVQGNQFCMQFYLLKCDVG